MAHKLLLADDSVTIQRVIELTFADEDVQVMTAGDGEQAIASIQADRPDIVLADIGMPKRSGYDVAAFVKGAPELAHIPVLLLTGAFEPVDERRAQAAGCDGVLVKPFEPQHVIARVRELLHGAARHARPAGNVTRAVSDVPRPAERLTSPQRTHPPAKPASGGNGAADSALEDYFDRLDAAFANITNQAEPSPGRSPEVPARREGPVMEQDLDWFDSPAPQAAAAPAHGATPRAESLPAQAIDIPPAPAPMVEPVPVTFASPPSTPAWPLPQPPSIEPADTPPVIAPQTAPRVSMQQVQHAQHVPAAESGSTIADVFSALLAAEQGEGAPVRLAVGPPPAPAVTDEFVNDIAERVMQRLGPAAVEGVVADVVSRVAERLVREEIERIRRNAK
jgi:CheY-like chemotaxis protein